MKKFAREIDLTTGNLFRKLLIFALPFLLGNLLNSIYFAVDLFFIGQFSNESNMAAVASGSTVMFAINSVLLGLAAGGTIVLGKHIGAKSDKVGGIAKSYYLYMTIITVATVVIMLALFYPLVSWLNLTGETADAARKYLLILIIGIPFYSIYHSIACALKAHGDSRAEFLFLAITIFVNIALDALFIITLKMGAFGAAIATTLGEIIGAITALAYLYFVKSPYKLPGGSKFDKSPFRDFAKCGVPIAIQDGLVIFSFSIILAAISKRGDSFTSAVGVTDRVTSFGFAVLGAIGCAISTAVAQNVGAKNINNVRKYLKYGILVSLVCGTILTASMILFAPQLASLFAGDNLEARDLAKFYIMSTCLDLFICSFVFPLNDLFVGAGRSVFSMTQNLVTTFLFRLPIALAFAYTDKPLFIIGFAYPLSTIFSLGCCIVFYFSNRWISYTDIDPYERKI